MKERRSLTTRNFSQIESCLPGMIPYLKGFHLIIEMWKGNHDKDRMEAANYKTCSVYYNG